ncbi:MAG: nitroreductase family protein [Defluviitaleaceae bacterium]|nr:nitroreductase family protein [Defluviitaleaceae bacterium]
MNEVLKTIENRYSCRGYTGAPVEEEKIKLIAKAALHSPSAVNQQKWRLKIITNKKLIDRLSDEALEFLKNDPKSEGAYKRILDRGGICYYNAPCMILVLKDVSEEVQKMNNLDIDCGILVQNMAIAATSLGLNNVIAAMTSLPFKGENSQELKKLVGWSENLEFGIGFLVGYGNNSKEPHEIDWDKVEYIN